MSNTYRPSALQEAQRHRCLAAASALGLDAAATRSIMRSALQSASRSQRASTTFRLLAERLEARAR